MNVRREAHRQRAISPQRAHALLNPAAALLKASGITKMQALDLFAAAFDEVSAGRGRRVVERIGHPLHADILQAWHRRAKYLDGEGQPRALAYRGSGGFESLAREVDTRIDPRETLKVLIRYGSVRKASRGRFRVVRSFLGAATRRTVAFEPTASFLRHANDALSRSLSNTRPKRGPFWYRVEGFCPNEATEKRFRVFARARGLLFLEELDDWLDAHNSQSRAAGSKRRRRRVGVGLFSFDSKADYA
jgi:hypothetical protein